MPTARCSTSTTRLPDKRSRMIQAGGAGADVVSVDLTLDDAAEAGHQVQGRCQLPSPVSSPSRIQAPHGKRITAGKPSIPSSPEHPVLA